MQRTALFPGSFDPFTRGHAAFVEQALGIFDRVVIAIGHNIAKRGLLDIDARRRLIEDCYKAQPRVEVTTYTTLTGDEARRAGAATIIRGARTAADFDYERILDQANRRLFPELASIVIMVDPQLADISSSLVRELLSFGRSIDQFMPEGIDLKKYLTNE